MLLKAFCSNTAFIIEFIFQKRNLMKYIKLNNLGEVFTYHFYDAEDNEISKLVARELYWSEIK